MPKITDLIIPVIISVILIFGLVKGINVFDCFVTGASDGMKTAFKILPSLVALVTAVGMFKASGALDVLTHSLRTIVGTIGIPAEVVPLSLLRPISGSGALVIFEDIITSHGPDSFIGRVASVMQGSTETTFYTIAVYYGATKVKQTRHTLGAALSGDLTGLIVSSFAVTLFLGR